MNRLETYIERLRTERGYVVGENDPIFVLWEFLQYYERDLSELSQQTLSSWVSHLDKRREEFNDAIKLRAERTIRECLRLTRTATEETFKESAELFFNEMRKELDVEKEKLAQERNLLQWIGIGVILSTSFCTGIFLAKNFL